MGAAVEARYLASRVVVVAGRQRNLGEGLDDRSPGEVAAEYRGLYRRRDRDRMT
jgi:hypothetical protein